MRTYLSFALVLTSLISTRALADPSSKRPAPDDATQTQVTESIRNLYKAEYQSAKTPEQRTELAKKLLQIGVESKDDAHGRYVLFRIARDLAADAGDFYTSMSAIDSLDNHYDVDALAMRADVLPKLVKVLRLPNEHQEFAPRLEKSTQDSIAQDRFDVAKRINAIALESARQANSATLVKQVVAMGKGIAELEGEYTKIKTALVKLDSSATDPAANLLAGKYLCFFKDDWDNGVLMLALGGDERFRMLAIEELADSPDPMKLGDGWWEIADSLEGRPATAARSRSRSWYQKALPTLAGLAKAQVEVKLSEESKGSEALKVNEKKNEKVAKTNPLSQTFPGTFQVIAISAKTNERRDSFYEFRSDGVFLRDKTPLGEWQLNGNVVALRFTNSTTTGTIKPTNAATSFSGSITEDGGKKWTVEAVRLTVVAVWRHQAGSGAPGNMALWSNGRIGSPGGQAKWSLNGNKLVLRWPAGWIDTCTVSADGRRYEGRNQNGTLITGTLVTSE